MDTTKIAVDFDEYSETSLSGENVTFRATDYIEINGTFTLNTGGVLLTEVIPQSNDYSDFRQNIITICQ